MSRYLSNILMMFVLGFVAGPPVSAHDGKIHDAGPAASSAGPTVHKTITVAPDGSGAPTVEVAQGAHVVLEVLGVGPGALHLHGYSIDVVAEAGAPAVLTFDAAHAGRFPVVKHVTDLLLGDLEKPVLFVEVRAP